MITRRDLRCLVWLGALLAIQFSPVLFFGLAGGVFVDRFDRRLTIIVVDAIRAAAFLSIAVVYYFSSLSVEYLYAVIFLEALLANFFNPARAALLPHLVDGFDRITGCLEFGENDTDLSDELLHHGWMAVTAWFMVPELSYAIGKCRPVDLGGD